MDNFLLVDSKILIKQFVKIKPKNPWNSFQGFLIFLNQPPEGNSPSAVSFRRLPHMVVMMDSVQKLCHVRFSLSLSKGPDGQ
ncbi:hypothetical protein L2719_11220 [Shewanella schlegeliana]|uniref:Uncharacterized protein n=1 Tax=Shewanella schlegeliana TaxID=190308 RepID=A0ABS1SVJ8_9GAMM|nr:hypothetical protein [Shewanella schlegeliana]MBL4911929.1 hypothetical protein [Shewanella schlegeliana]MCL1110118.1 hypothetical protein [Shewanella schlegeliana]